MPKSPFPTRSVRLAAFFAPLAMAVVTLCAGCQSTQYSAAQVPSHLLASPSNSPRSIQLGNLATSGGNSDLIATGDLLEVHVSSGIEEKPPEPYIARVGEDGTVELPLLGPVNVAGMEPAAASRHIAAAAVERGVYRRPNVTVAVSEQATNKVMVLGAVSEPGLHKLPKNSSNVLSAIAAAGGLTEEAGFDVEVLRHSFSYLASNGPSESTDPASLAAEGVVQQAGYAFEGPALKQSHPEVERICLADASSGQAQPRTLGDRDVVMVLPKEKQVIYVTGLVARPDQFELPEDQPLRLLDAVAMAGGMSSPVADKVIVIRQSQDGGDPASISASISKAKTNGQENLILAPGDLVSVESTLATTVLTGFKDFFRVTMGVSSRLTPF
jgi:polysaccharide export outer membrane protein